MRNINMAILLAGFAVTACDTPAPSYTKPEPHAVIEASTREEIQTTATVRQLNSGERLVQVETSKGEFITIKAGPEVVNFDQIRIGDVVSTTYKTAAIAVLAPSDLDLGTEAELAKVRRAEGEKPGVLAGAAIHEVVEFVSYDHKSHNVVFKRVDGFVRTVTLRKTEMQDFAQSLVKGDKVEIGFTEALAIEVNAAQ